MTRYKIVEIIIALICFFGMLASAGCSQHIHTVTCTSEGVEYRSVLKQNLFLYYTDTKQMEEIGPFSSLCVGDIKSMPDPNSIKAVVEGAVEGLLR